MSERPTNAEREQAIRKAMDEAFPYMGPRQQIEGYVAAMVALLREREQAAYLRACEDGIAALKAARP